MDIKKIFDKYFNGDSKKTVRNMVIVILCGVLLILIADVISGLNSRNSSADKSDVEVNTTIGIPVTSSAYEEKIKKDLTDTLSLISGVGKVTVMIYFEGGSESIPAVNINNTNRKTDEKDNQGGIRVTTEENKNTNVVVIDKNNATEPFIVKQVNPDIGGVMVVAEGATSSEMKEKIHNAVKTVLNLAPNNVTVMPMKK
jgi:stage III sporulation protein AG